MGSPSSPPGSRDEGGGAANACTKTSSRLGLAEWLFLGLFLPACLPAMVLLSGLLPNLCKYWSWESGSSTGPNAGSIKGIQNIELSAAQANEAVVTLVLGYWYDGGVINFKLWTDVATYYGFIY